MTSTFKRFTALTALLLAAITGTTAAAQNSSGQGLGSISIAILDSAKKGVSGVNITVKTQAGEAGEFRERTVTTGGKGPSDTEIAAAVKEDQTCKCHALDNLMARYSGRVVVDGLATGPVVLTVDAKGAAPVTVTITDSEPAWNVLIAFDAKGKKLVGTPKASVDEVAGNKVLAAESSRMKAEAEQARADAARFKAEAAERARAEADARAAAEAARASEAASRAREAEAAAAAAKAQQDAGAETQRRQRSEAPSKVSAGAIGCRCAPGRVIVVTCRVVNNAEVPVSVTVGATARTGFLGVPAAGAAAITLDAGQSNDLLVNASINTKEGDCNSCKASQCAVARVVAR